MLLTTIIDHTKTGASASSISKLTPGIAFSGKASPQSPFMLRLFYKHVFRMPTFNDLYYNLIGNTSLRPEYARQYNAGLVYSKSFTGRLKHFSISADAYYNTVKDKIIAVPNKNLFVWTMLNLGKVNIKGVDVTAEAGGDLCSRLSWFTRVAYTWQQALDVTDPSSTTYKNRIPYTPDHSGSGLVSFQYRKWSAGYSLLFSGARYTLGENNPYNQLAGWGTQDVFVSRNLSLKWCRINIKAEMDNLSNQHYDIVRYFPMPGRSYKINLLFSNL
jgi:vitamin B12 transporter